MIELGWPWALAALPLPLLAWFLLPRAKPASAALRVPVIDEFEFENASASAIGKGKRWRLWAALLAWLLLSVAAARPTWVGAPVELGVSGRDLMLAVDLSGSMDVEDFRLNRRLVDRLTATKFVASEFISRREGDRVGLILFGRQAYLQAPLTFDRDTVATLLDESVVGLAGRETAIGDAIGLSIKTLRDNDAKDRVVILLTDGANTAGLIDPLRAAEIAANEGLKIYTIGIGADELMTRSFFGRRLVNPSADLDEKTLTEIARLTAGQYFRARDARELERIYHLIDQLEPVEREKKEFRPQRALFYWPLALALVFGGLIGASRVRAVS